MNKYESGKIYKLVDDTTNAIYIGSTIQKYLSKRLQGHKSSYNSYQNGKIKHIPTSSQIIKNGSYHIELIENYPCKNRMELEKRERHYIETLDCVNHNIPCQSPEEKLAYRIAYDKSPERIEIKRQYYLDNREERLQKANEYRKKNLYSIRKKSLEFYYKNREEINKQRKLLRKSVK